jgi:hypothetical protein
VSNHMTSEVATAVNDIVQETSGYSVEVNIRPQNITKLTWKTRGIVVVCHTYRDSKKDTKRSTNIP